MKTWVRDNKGFIAFMLMFGLFRTAVADWNPIPSASMHPNLLEGDVVFVNRLAFDLKVPLTNKVVTHLGEPQRGDVVTFYSPSDGTRLIKRIVAVPGDTVSMENDRLTINGQPASYTLPSGAVETLGNVGKLQAVQITEKAGAAEHRIQLLPEIMSDKRNFAPMTIPPGQYMMLGDNRNNSADSRYIGLVPRELLIGRAERVLVSADIEGNWHPRTDRFLMALNR
ncbi:signal peptidase I [Pseudoduganella ginsengisoli]|uniref:Signal peptidase I n=1 Tax=Pseudoduganella ginsengisoli TaxID=1462440 RepID=A0A6L6PWE9_9BURK|nr:signal peptidase I [Pseudoduganella ginsengisoli]MTW01903.1 signal peptidase I [Pseudoduganella ginsengisoli]